MKKKLKCKKTKECKAVNEKLDLKNKIVKNTDKNKNEWKFEWFKKKNENGEQWFWIVIKFIKLL